jgi:hypothetical protein
MELSPVCFLEEPEMKKFVIGCWAIVCSGFFTISMLVLAFGMASFTAGLAIGVKADKAYENDNWHRRMLDLHVLRLYTDAISTEEEARYQYRWATSLANRTLLSKATEARRGLEGLLRLDVHYRDLANTLGGEQDRVVKLATIRAVEASWSMPDGKGDEPSTDAAPDGKQTTDKRYPLPTGRWLSLPPTGPAPR